MLRNTAWQSNFCDIVEILQKTSEKYEFLLLDKLKKAWYNNKAVGRGGKEKRGISEGNVFWTSERKFAENFLKEIQKSTWQTERYVI